MIDRIIRETGIGALGVYLLYSNRMKIPKIFSLGGSLLLTAILLALEINISSDTLYDVLGVPHSADKAVIVSAFRSKSKTMHPDHAGPGQPDVEERYAELKKAYETLSHTTMKSNYDKLGDIASAFDKESLADTEKLMSGVLALAAVAQCMFFILGYIATFPEMFRTARQLVVLYNFIVFCAELYMRFVDDSFFQNFPFFDVLNTFERIALLRKIFPAFLVFVLGVSAYVYEHSEVDICKLLESVQVANKVLLERTNMLMVLAAGWVPKLSGQKSSDKRSKDDNVSETTSSKSDNRKVIIDLKDADSSLNENNLSKKLKIAEAGLTNEQKKKFLAMLEQAKEPETKRFSLNWFHVTVLIIAAASWYMRG